MRSKEFHGVRISGLACSVPNHKVMTESYTDHFGETVIRRFISATGIESRYISDGSQTVSDLSFTAADALMKAKGLEPVYVCISFLLSAMVVPLM